MNSINEQRRDNHASGMLKLVTIYIVAACVGLLASPLSAETVDELEPEETTTDQDMIDDASLLAFADDDNEFAALSLEELMNVQVTSVAGVEESLVSTPSAIYVINSEDIRRSGHQHLAEIFRQVPGANVARLSARQWSFSIRNEDNLFSNTMLVLMDGRQLYDSSFNGVFWDAHDLIYNDVEQIEVIRGPGATIWGANAVDGVININSKSAKDTQGLYASGLTGLDINAIGQVRYGGQIDDDTHYRVWTKFKDLDNFETSAGPDGYADWNMFHAGFRVDRQVDDQTTLTLDSTASYSHRIGENYPVATVGVPGSFDPRIDDGHQYSASLLVRAEHEEENSGWIAQGYVDWYVTSRYAGGKYHRISADVEYRSHHNWGEQNQHKFIWGAHYRVDYDDIDPSTVFVFDPGDTDLHRVDLFAQNTWTLEEERWFAMVGSKFEYNTNTQFEIQPSARIWHTPNKDETYWFAISRPVRIPGRTERDMIFTVVDFGGVPPSLVIAGSDTTQAEEYLFLEVGYRDKLNEKLTADFTAFWVDGRRILEPLTGPGVVTNSGEDVKYGAEAMLIWKPEDSLRLEGSYSFLQIDEDGPFSSEPNIVEHQAKFRAAADITDNLELNTTLVVKGNNGGLTPRSHTRLDVGIAYRLNENTDISVWGQNLLEPNTLEVADAYVFSPTEVPRSLFLQITWRD